MKKILGMTCFAVSLLILGLNAAFTAPVDPQACCADCRKNCKDSNPTSEIGFDRCLRGCDYCQHPQGCYGS